MQLSPLLCTWLFLPRFSLQKCTHEVNVFLDSPTHPHLTNFVTQGLNFKYNEAVCLIVNKSFGGGISYIN